MLAAVLDAYDNGVRPPGSGPDARATTVLMQNSGLPEAGDAVLAFPPEVVADPERYATAAALPPGTGPATEAAARRRRDPGGVVWTIPASRGTSACARPWWPATTTPTWNSGAPRRDEYALPPAVATVSADRS